MGWTCEKCGEESCTQGLCASCITPEEDDGYCTYCAGTGEGMHDGTRCSACGGKGFVRPAPEFDEDAESDYFYSRLGVER